MDKDEIISKVKNMYIMLLYAISREDIDRVRQYLSDDLAKKYESIIKENIENNLVQRYGELNVSKVEIISEENNVITLQLVVKYIDYKIDRKTKKYVSGETTRHSYYKTLRVTYNLDNKAIVYRCKNCGAQLNVNLTSVCSYCGEPVDNEDSLFVIESIN